MVQIGFHNEGSPSYPLKRLDSGWVIPDVSVSEIHEYNQRLATDMVDLPVHAESFGYDYVFHTENHLNPLGTMSPAPVQIQTAIAQRTDTIRMVQMAVSLPWHDPIRLAERLSILDLLSDGRMDVGIGTGFGDRENEVFGQHGMDQATDGDERIELFYEQYELLKKAWTEDFFSHHGEFYRYPPTDVGWDNDLTHQYLDDDVSGHDPDAYIEDDSGEKTLKSISVYPQPEQEPHPQIWRACGSPESVKWSAKEGINVCMYGTDFSALGKLVDFYHEVSAAAGWPDRRPEYDGEPFRHGWDAQRRRGVVAQVPVFITDVTSEEAFERWKLGLEFIGCMEKAVAPPERADEVAIAASEQLEGDAPIVGDTETVIDGLAGFVEAVDFEGYMLVPSFTGPGMRKEDKLDQLRGFAEEVSPYFDD